MRRRGRKSAAQTPAPQSDRITGSKVNPKGSASSEKSAEKIVLSEKTITALKGKLAEFKKTSNKNITLNDLKAVYRRGSGAYSGSHRPGIPRNAWAMARVNKFLKKAKGEKVKAAYVQDDDLLANGGEIGNYGYIESFQITNACIEEVVNIINSVQKVKDFYIYDGKLVIVFDEELMVYSVERINHHLQQFTECHDIIEPEVNLNYGEDYKSIFINLKVDNATIGQFADGGLMVKGDDGSQNFGIPKVNFGEIPFIHETSIENAEKILNGGFKIPDKNITKGVYTIPAPFKKEKFNKNHVDLIIWLKDNSKIFWTNTKTPSDFYIGYGNIFYQNLYKKLNPDSEHTLKNQAEFIGSSIQGEFCRKLENWLKENGYCGVQQGGEIVITNTDCIDYVEKENIEKLAKGKRLTQGTGDCYYIAGQFAMAENFSPMAPAQIDFIGTPYVVQAEVRGQGSIEGLRYGHAWIEDDENVYDYSNNRELVLPKQFYYAIGDIKTDDPKKYRKYTFAEARKRMLETGHYGCWDIDVKYDNGGDIRYADGGEVSELVALHNINAYQIKEANKIGGLITPSIAILKAGQPFADFGQITLIGNRELVNPERESVRVFAGDVYSPSVPRKLYYVEDRKVDKEEERILKAYYNNDTKRLHDEVYEIVKREIGEYSEFKRDLNKMDYESLLKYYEDRLKIVYLIDKQKTFDVPMKEKRHYLYNNLEFSLTPEQKQRFQPIIKRYTEESNEKGSGNISKKTQSDLYDLFLEVLEQENNRIREQYKDDQEIVDYFIKSTKEAFEKKIGTRYDFSGMAEYKLSRAVYGEQELDKDRLDKIVNGFFNKDTKKDYEKWLRDFISQFRGAAYFLDGRNKVPYTKDNLVEATTKRVVGQEENLTYGANKAKSYSTKEFKTIDEIKKKSTILVSKEEMNGIDEENKAGFFALSNKLKYEYSSEWEKLNSLGKALADYFRGKSAQTALSKNDFKGLSSYEIDEFKEYADQLKNSPVDYFEAKIGRAVNLSEFQYAVIPKETDKEIIDILKENGLKIKRYETPEQRTEEVNKIVEKKKLKFEQGGTLEKAIQLPDVQASEESLRRILEMQGYKLEKTKNMEEGGIFSDLVTPEEQDIYLMQKFEKYQTSMAKGGDTNQNVTCVNCGWSWNTADSDESDKYLCHKCGFDNTLFNEKLLKRPKNIKEISEMYSVPVDILEDEVKKGIEHEMEHTNDVNVARTIALHHIAETPNYYEKLQAAKLEKGGMIKDEAKEYLDSHIFSIFNYMLSRRVDWEDSLDYTEYDDKDTLHNHYPGAYTIVVYGDYDIFVYLYVGEIEQTKEEYEGMDGSVRKFNINLLNFTNPKSTYRHYIDSYFKDVKIVDFKTHGISGDTLKIRFTRKNPKPKAPEPEKKKWKYSWEMADGGEVEAGVVFGKFGEYGDSVKEFEQMEIKDIPNNTLVRMYQEFYDKNMYVTPYGWYVKKSKPTSDMHDIQFYNPANGEPINDSLKRSEFFTTDDVVSVKTGSLMDEDGRFLSKLVDSNATYIVNDLNPSGGGESEIVNINWVKLEAKDGEMYFVDGNMIIPPIQKIEEKERKTYKYSWEMSKGGSVGEIYIGKEVRIFNEYADQFGLNFGEIVGLSSLDEDATYELELYQNKDSEKFEFIATRNEFYTIGDIVGVKFGSLLDSDENFLTKPVPEDQNFIVEDFAQYPHSTDLVYLKSEDGNNFYYTDYKNIIKPREKKETKQKSYKYSWEMAKGGMIKEGDIVELADSALLDQNANQEFPNGTGISKYRIEDKKFWQSSIMPYVTEIGTGAGYYVLLENIMKTDEVYEPKAGQLARFLKPVYIGLKAYNYGEVESKVDTQFRLKIFRQGDFVTKDRNEFFVVFDKVVLKPAMYKNSIFKVVSINPYTDKIELIDVDDMSFRVVEIAENVEKVIVEQANPKPPQPEKKKWKYSWEMSKGGEIPITANVGDSNPVRVWVNENIYKIIDMYVEGVAEVEINSYETFSDYVCRVFFFYYKEDRVWFPATHNDNILKDFANANGIGYYAAQAHGGFSKDAYDYYIQGITFSADKKEMDSRKKTEPPIKKWKYSWEMANGGDVLRKARRRGSDPNWGSFYVVGDSGDNLVVVIDEKISQWNESSPAERHYYYEELVPKSEVEYIEQQMADGGVVVGKRHSESDENGSGEKFMVQSTGQVVELEGGEGVLCRQSMSSDKKYEFMGKEMNARQIASFLNHKYGGVEFAKGGAVAKKVCGCRAYYHGGEVPSATLNSLEGGEAVVTVKTMESKDKYDFQGAKMTPRQILSKINSDAGGKKFEEGGVIDLSKIKLDNEIRMVKMLHFCQNILYYQPN